jgi:TrmH family RNA methyltransferase
VIGNEGNGVSEAVKASADVRIKIPIYGKAESLNASVAAGILIYKIKSIL